MRSRSQRTSAPEAPRAGQLGFSITELMVGSAITLSLAAAMMTVFMGVQRTTVRQEARDRATGELRLVMQRLTKEIRQASSVYTGSGVSVLDMDTYVDGVQKRITYTAAGTTLTRAEGTTTTVVLERMTSISVFTYVPDATDPATIGVSLRVRPALYSNDPAEMELTSEAQLRNRG